MKSRCVKVDVSARQPANVERKTSLTEEEIAAAPIERTTAKRGCAATSCCGAAAKAVAARFPTIEGISITNVDVNRAGAEETGAQRGYTTGKT